MTLPPQYTTRKNELFWLWLIMLKLYLKEKEWQKRYMCIHLTTRPFVLALESTPETKLPLWLGWLLELPRQGWDNPHCISWGEKRFVEIYPSEYYSSINWYVERMTQIIGCYVFLTKKNMHFFLLMGWMFCCLGVKTKHSVRVFLLFSFLKACVNLNTSCTFGHNQPQRLTTEGNSCHCAVEEQQTMPPLKREIMFAPWERRKGRRC